MDIEQVIRWREDKEPKLWSNLFKENIPVKHRSSESRNVAKFMAEKYMELAMDDILDEGEEVAFYDRQGDLYMTWAMLDVKNVTGRASYRYNAKYRGHYYSLCCYMPRKIQQRAGISFLKLHPQESLYARIKRKIIGGMDYRECPDPVHLDRVHEIMNM